MENFYEKNSQPVKFVKILTKNIQGVSKKLCFTILLISQLIIIVERRAGYLQNWHGKRLLTICECMNNELFLNIAKY